MGTNLMEQQIILTQTEEHKPMSDHKNNELKHQSTTTQDTSEEEVTIRQHSSDSSIADNTKTVEVSQHTKSEPVLHRKDGQEDISIGQDPESWRTAHRYDMKERPQQQNIDFFTPLERGWFDLNVRVLYRVARVIEIVVCLLVIFIAFLIILILTFSPYPRQHSAVVYGLTGLVLLTNVIGLIGATGHILWCSLIYSVINTFLIPYCIVCWFVTIGIYKKWYKPPSLEWAGFRSTTG